jgi:ParB family chromosome partitioning protein
MGAPTTDLGLVQIPIDQIEPAEENFRGPVSDEDVAELAELVRAQGILQPLTVTPMDDGRYKLVFGHRRLRAAALIGLTTVPAQVRELTDAERLAAMLAENLGRKDLTALQEARAFQAMLQLTGDDGKPRYTQRTLAQALGVGQAKVSNYTAIFKLPDDVVALLDSGDITVMQAIALARLAKHPDRVRTALDSIRRGGDAELVVRRQLEEVEREKARAKKLKELKATGVKLAPDDWMTTGGQRLGTGWLLEIEPEQHASEPCHAAMLNFAGDVVYVCMEPARHRPAPPASAEAKMEPAEQARASTAAGPSASAEVERTPEEEAAETARLVEAERQRLAEEERLAAEQAKLQALQTAAEARTIGLKTLLGGRLSRADAARRFLSRVVLDLFDGGYDEGFVVQVLGLEADNGDDGGSAELVAEFAAKSDDALLRVAVAVACDQAEEQLQGEYPNFANALVRRYFKLLLDAGVYELSEVERGELVAVGVDVPDAPVAAGAEVAVTGEVMT